LREDINMDKNANVLIVDDEEGVRKTICRILKRDNYNLFTAESVANALKILSSTDIDVVISDINLPKLSGVELLRTLKEKSPNINVIMITGEPSLETAIDSVQQGAFDYLTKPFNIAKLSNTVNKAVKLKISEDERRKLQEENYKYQHQLERLVELKNRELYKSEKRLRRFFDHSPDAIIVTDQEGIIQHFNDCASVLYGFEDDELFGVHLTSLIDKEEGDKFATSFSSVIKLNPIDIELVGLTKENERILLWRKAIPILDDSGNLLEILIYDRKISFMKWMTRIMREYETGYHFLLSNNPAPVIVHDLNGKIIEHNSIAHSKLLNNRENWNLISNLFQDQEYNKYEAYLKTLNINNSSNTGDFDCTIFNAQQQLVKAKIFSQILKFSDTISVLSVFKID
jgi:PAS domain S-box-containing protein